MAKDRKIRLNNKMVTKDVLAAQLTNYLMEHALLSKEVAQVTADKVPMLCLELSEEPDLLGRYHLVENDYLRAFCMGIVAHKQAQFVIKYNLSE